MHLLIMETDKKNRLILNKLSHMVFTFLGYMSQEVLSQKEGCEKWLESSKYEVSGPGDFLLCSRGLTWQSYMAWKGMTIGRGMYIYVIIKNDEV